MAPHTSLSRGLRSGEFGGQQSFSMISGQSACSHSCLTRAVCAGAPSSWKMNLAGINCLQSLLSLISILCTGTHELLLCPASLFTQRLHSHFVRMRHFTHFNCVSKKSQNAGD